MSRAPGDGPPGHAPIPSDADDDPLAAGRMTLMDHLRELRNRLIKCVAAVVAGTVIVWILYPQIYEILVRPLCQVEPESCRLALRDPLEGFTIRLRVSGYGGVALAMPVILWQFWKFITPGLYPNEKRYAVPFVASSLMLFVMGAALAYFALARALDFLIRISGDVEVLFSPEPYIRLITYMMLAFGIGFLFPVLLVFLQLLGVLDVATLRKYRRIALVGILILVAVITPSGDPYTLMMLSVPMYVFYEVSILIGAMLRRRRAADPARS
jgi:sec-independent protein translocase protein TatC